MAGIFSSIPNSTDQSPLSQQQAYYNQTLRNWNNLVGTIVRGFKQIEITPHHINDAIPNQAIAT